MQFNIKPVLTEKTISDAKNGKYTFLVPVDFNKHKIKEVINKAFGVNVTSVATMKYKGRVKRNVYRNKIKTSDSKKAIVKLTDKQTIDIFGGNNK